MAKVKGSTPKKRVSKKDSWANQLNGLGDITRDKRLSAVLNTTAKLTDRELEDLFRSNDLAQNIISVWPEETWREGYDLVIGEDHDLAVELRSLQDDLQVAQKLKLAAQHSRHYGGAAVLIGTDDVDQNTPLKPGTEITHLTVFPRQECRPIEWFSNPLSKNYGKARTYQITPQIAADGAERTVSFDLLKVHSSRILHFGGIFSSRTQMIEQYGYGDSVLQSIHEILRDFEMTWDAAAILMNDFSQAVIKVANLAENMMAEEDNYLKNRMTAIDMSRSVARAVILDGDTEDFSRVPTPMSGFPEVLDRFLNRVAAAARIPVTMLFGQAPAGLNATGDSDIRHFYSRVRAHQCNEITPMLEALTRLLMAQIGKEEPDSWEIKWRSLWAPTELESAQARFVQAQTDDLEIGNGTITPEEAARSRHGARGYSFETTIDLEARDQMEADRVEQETALAEAEVEKAKNPAPAPFGGGGGKPPAETPPGKKPPFGK